MVSCFICGKQMRDVDRDICEDCAFVDCPNCSGIPYEEDCQECDTCHGFGMIPERKFKKEGCVLC